MATQQLSLGSYPGVSITLSYDDVTGAASLVQGVNTSAHDCFVQVTNVNNPAQTGSGLLRAGQTSSFNVAGLVSLNQVVLPGGDTAWELTTWTVQTRWPA